MSKLVCRMRRAFSMLPLALAAPALPAFAAEPPTVVVIFDGSGSMWGKPDGEQKTKLVLARDALRLSLKHAQLETRIGLMSFGHRRSGDCNDVETIIKPEAGTYDRISGVLEKHNPRGRGPLTQALREAAKELGPQSAPASVILIHDDLDNCQLDPCSALGDLRRAHPKVQVHVVSMAMKREDAQKLQCLTKSTGGRHYEAATTTQVNAAIDEAIKLAVTDEGRTCCCRRSVGRGQGARASRPEGATGTTRCAAFCHAGGGRRAGRNVAALARAEGWRTPGAPGLRGRRSGAAARIADRAL